jgi:hypothetical protein
MRPATTLPSRPGNVFSCHGVYEPEMRSQIFLDFVLGEAVLAQGA